MTTTIDAENAKQIRRQMDVLIRVEPESGDPIVINNENLIRAVVSLRSDLSIISPTFPASELNVEAYFDDDISEELAQIPNDTPITYRAGYDSDMSPVRKFYLAEQITWNNNVMSIHAVDAVHFMDVRVDPMKLISGDVSFRSSNPTSFSNVYSAMEYLLGKKLGIITYDDIENIDELDDYEPTPDRATYRSFAALNEETIREFIASTMWLFHFDMTVTGAPTDSIWFTYVDAGMPKLTWSKPGSIWDIYEEDCGNIQKKVERKIRKVSVPIRNYEQCEADDGGGISGGNAEWIKYRGMFLHFEKLMLDYAPRYDGQALPPVTEYGKNNNFEDDWSANSMPIEDLEANEFAELIYSNDLENGAIQGSVHYTDDSQWHDTIIYTSYIPWSTLSGRAWRDAVGAAVEDSVQVDLTGIIITEGTTTYSSGSDIGDGRHVEFTDPIWSGTVAGRFADSGGTYHTVTGFPHRSLARIRNMSPISGSFTWKGDPRMQPRDVFTFYRLDGTEEDCTIENITITHEKGGTSAEITYRKGIC